MNIQDIGKNEYFNQISKHVQFICRLISRNLNLYQISKCKIAVIFRLDY